MKAFIPMAIDERALSAVDESLERQTIPCQVIRIQSMRDPHCRRRGEFCNRNIIAQWSDTLHDSLVVMNCSDTAALYEDNIERMAEKILRDPGLGYVACMREESTNKDHIAIACSLWRADALSQMKLDIDNIGVCACLRYREMLGSLGLRAEYLTDKIRVKTLERSRA